MQRLATRLTLALAGVAALAPALAAQDGAAPNVAGTWLFSLASPDSVGGYEVPVTFKQDGSRVTGTIDLSDVPQVQAAEITDGVFEDGVLTFRLHVGAEGQRVTVEVRADVDGDEMAGEARMPEMGMTSPFRARRAPG